MHSNRQKTAKVLTDPREVYLHHIFPTIQGEGPFAGTPAIFVRLNGCNLQCPFCDTDYTSQLTIETPDSLLQKMALLQPVRARFALVHKPLVVITGGEPFRQAGLLNLVREMVLAGYRVQIETNGTLWLEEFPADKCTIVCSPKTPKIHPELAKRVHAFKYVIDAGHVHPEDGLPCGTLGKYEMTARPPEGWEGDVFVQPLDEGAADAERNKLHLEAAVKSCLRFGYRLCIQTHKLANLE